MKKLNKKVIVLLSGGVDSAVAAYLLKKESYDVIGITLKLWGKELCGVHGEKSCCSIEGVENARAVCDKLDIPHYVVNLEKEFNKRVIEYFCREYENALTPNPCIVCNEKIKFDLGLNKLKVFNANYVSSGHYAGVWYNKKTKRYYIREGKDKTKDQSYVLFGLGQEVLSRLILPLGEFTKKKVREIARRASLGVHNKKESQEICFVPDDNYGKFVMSRTNLDFLPGSIETLDGVNLGEHRGIIHYTIGQRRGMGIAYKEPLYIVKILHRENKIIVGTKKDTFKKILTAKDVLWVEGIPKKPIKAKVKIRYNHKKSDATIFNLGAKKARVEFKNPQSSPSPGQAVVFYRKDLVLGGGWIEKVLD